MADAVWVRGYRVAFALLALVALAVQLDDTRDKPTSSPANFFSFFTVESNLIASAVFLLGALTALRFSRDERWDLVRGLAVFAMTATFIIYGLLLSGYQEELQTTLPWVDTVVHRIFPIVVLLDWIIVTPAHRLTFKRASLWLVFPAVYAVYSWIRGARVHWYPYPFLDPRHDGGWGLVIVYSIAIAIGMAVLVWLLVMLSRHVRLGRA